MQFPDKLDGAAVLYHTPKGDFGDLYDTEGGIAAHYCYLAICRYASGEYYLFFCNEQCEVESDYDFDSAEACMHCAEANYGDVTWIMK